MRNLGLVMDLAWGLFLLCCLVGLGVLFCFLINLINQATEWHCNIFVVLPVLSLS